MELMSTSKQSSINMVQVTNFNVTVQQTGRVKLQMGRHHMNLKTTMSSIVTSAKVKNIQILLCNSTQMWQYIDLVFVIQLLSFCLFSTRWSTDTTL